MDSWEIDEKFFEVANELACHNGLFQKLWEMGKPIFTDNPKIETAAVSFNREGGFVQFLFNRDFFARLSSQELAFVVSHECLHVILNHGKRLKGLHPQIANVAADITINEMLTTSLGFDPNLPVIQCIKVGEDGKPNPACLIKTVFSEEQQKTIEKDREFEYYYNKLMNGATFQKCKISIGGDNDGLEPLDSHEGLPDELIQEIEEAIKNLSESDKETLAKNIKAGDGDAFEWIQSALKPKPNKAWESVIQDWTVKMWREKRKTQWKHTNRRFTLVQGQGGLSIPTEELIDEKQNERIDILFFMDISGSCVPFAEKFFQCAKTIPRDKFLVVPYAFNTINIPIDLDADKLPAGGGTSFYQIEEECLAQKKYPSAVFVLTDGYGDNVNPKYPDRWHVFLTVDYRECFPKNVKFYDFDALFNGKKKILGALK